MGFNPLNVCRYRKCLNEFRYSGNYIRICLWSPWMPRPARKESEVWPKRPHCRSRYPICGILWRMIWRGDSSNAIPNSSALVELFALLSPSTGPEQRAIVSLIVPPVQVNRMHHPKELLPSTNREPSFAILMRRPWRRCLMRRLDPIGAKWRFFKSLAW